MMFKLKSSESSFMRPRVTPDPDQAALLERKMNELSYYPVNGFHRDLRQVRHPRLISRLAR
jgi:hypothetical protein